jgi:flagellar biosynthetic protein FliO
MDPNILNTFLMLILAVGVIAGIMFLVKRISIKRNENKSTINLNVVTKITLQPKNHLFVVKVADKLLVLGVTDSSINILTELANTNNATPAANSDLPTVNKTNADLLTDDLIRSALNQSKVSNNDLSFINFLKDSFKISGG